MRKQVELLAQHAVVALLGLFDVLQVIVKVFLREERGPIDPLQLRILLVSQPVRARDVQQLEGFDLARSKEYAARGRSR